MFVIQLLFWIVSLLFAILVFKPKIYSTNLNSPDLAHDMYQQIVAYKHSKLQWAHRWLVLGFVPLLINVLVYLVFIPVVKQD